MKKILLVLSITGFMFAEGKIGGVTYFDYSNTEKASGFNFQRQYFGYGGDVSDLVSFKILFDVGRSDSADTRLTTYLKKAQINYKSSFGKFNFGLIGMNTYGIQESNWGYRFIEKSAIDKNEDGEFEEKSEDTRLVVFLKKAQINYKSSFGRFNFGLIGMNTYAVQESNWGYRFIEKSAIDKNVFSSTADIGVGFSKSLIDNLNLSLLIVNGEGFKNPQGDKFQKIAFNATYGESNLNKNDGYNGGLVYTTESTDTDPTTMTSVFGGFAGMGLRLGGEYDMLTIGSVESNIISVSANYAVRDKIDIFARYDMVDDNDDTNKNGNNYLITGIVLDCDGGISVAPNLRMVNYENTDKDSEMEYKVNFQFKF